ncbi:RNA polymerase sigma factor [uncultured Tateyamaria sp.]|uniref:RNA polymerase sigma factor n=1 Tax=uncultured Tateyamaria sp. TaxID=455651 RepID=UPI002602721F|nr:RNA polymerase sigma factor [uncultured Tateyamaria sp.]
MKQHRPAPAPVRPATSVREIERTWHRQYTSFLRLANRLANGNAHVAEALVSRTTVRILEYVQKADQPIENIEAFFFASLRNSALDHWRRHNRETEGLRGLDHILRADRIEDETVQRIMARQELGIVAAHLSELPAEVTELVRLRILEHRPYSQIATRFGISETLARKRIQMARRLLRRRLNAENLGLGRHKTARRASNSTKHSHD